MPSPSSVTLSPALPLASLSMMPLAQLPSTTAPAGGGPAPVAPVAPANPAPTIEGPPAAAPGVAQAPTTGQSTGPGVTTTQQPAGAGTKPAEQPGPFSGLLSMLPIILMFVALYLFLFRGQKKEEKRRKALLSEMKKGDKVQTIGGLVASVVSIDNDEVVLKVDESANVKAVYKKSAILNVITPAGDKKSK
jgi:preprotein translocase subunit YajC